MKRQEFAKRAARLIGASPRPVEVEIGAVFGLALSPHVETCMVNIDAKALDGFGTQVAANGCMLPFESASINRVWFSFLFCSVSDPAEMWTEIKRVLRVGGEVIGVEHVAGHNMFSRKLQQGIDCLGGVGIFKCKTHNNVDFLWNDPELRLKQQVSFDGLIQPIETLHLIKSSAAAGTT